VLSVEQQLSDGGSAGEVLPRIRDQGSITGGVVPRRNCSLQPDEEGKRTHPALARQVNSPCPLAESEGT